MLAHPATPNEAWGPRFLNMMYPKSEAQKVTKNLKPADLAIEGGHLLLFLQKFLRLLLALAERRLGGRRLVAAHLGLRRAAPGDADARLREPLLARGRQFGLVVHLLHLGRLDMVLLLGLLDLRDAPPLRAPLLVPTSHAHAHHARPRARGDERV